LIIVDANWYSLSNNLINISLHQTPTKKVEY
jgi:hypothetical protein